MSNDNIFMFNCSICQMNSPVATVNGTVLYLRFESIKPRPVPRLYAKLNKNTFASA
jgi:hypothetical protein